MTDSNELGITERRERAEEARLRPEPEPEQEQEQESFTVEETRRQIALQTALNLSVGTVSEDPLGTLLEYAHAVENYLANGAIPKV